MKLTKEQREAQNIIRRIAKGLSSGKFRKVNTKRFFQQEAKGLRALCSGSEK